MKSAKIALTILIILTAGCSAGLKEKPVLAASAPAQKAICPDLIGYSLAFQQQVGNELLAAPGSALAQVVRDNTDTRDQIRICRGLPVPKRP